MKKTALITGITGQDGSYLAELLLSKNYDVHGIIRRESLENSEKIKNISQIGDKITLHVGSLSDHLSIYKIVSKVMPDECYHLAGSTFVDYSFDEEFQTINNNFSSTHYILSTIKEINPKCKLFFAGTSEMFGEPNESPQNENTPFNPKSIYGISKVSSHYLIKNYREKENIFACTGIMYNHESPRRGNQFVTKKIITSAVKIKKGFIKDLYLGNLDALRDWGYAPDYIVMMWKILQHDCADDYIMATGKLHSVREFLDIAFSYLELDYKDYVKVDDRFFRASEKTPLSGNTSKIKAILGFEHSKEFKEIIIEMIKKEQELYK
ncbi:MAG: GDP-mannose 4,6-dehydratase [Arcobacter sp.]|uniref:GDP-mannose 4,6-dehydratase n=1 Tax=uncultured Arcobacter sp. TaxID=165434 RepID=UPI000CA6D9BD|nr:GDP-mannose 4,6-dehydratase [uncultured Arcobacter sp.]PLY08725.1 MAG: GDP-mannose 4,6-dehydratase [Arcobacter sp.]